LKLHNKYDAVLFDLDGTVIFSHPGVFNGLKYALTKKGMEIPDESLLRKFIGPSFYDSFPKYMGTNKEETLELVDLYREYYKVKGVKEVNIIPGMDELIKSLYENGIKVILATGKPQPYAEEIICDLGLNDYFTGIVGSNLDGTRTQKEEVIEAVLENYDVKNPIMVGDREFDIIGANINKIDSVGVTFGYGTLDMFADYNPTFVANSVEELKSILLS